MVVRSTGALFALVSRSIGLSGQLTQQSVERSTCPTQVFAQLGVLDDACGRLCLCATLDKPTVRIARTHRRVVESAAQRIVLGREGLQLGRERRDKALDLIRVVAMTHDFQPMSDMRASAEYRMQIAQNLLLRFWLASFGDDRAVKVF